MSDEPVLLAADHDGVRTLTLNRPHKKHAINAQLWLALADAFRAAGYDRGVRALIVAGAAGDFCSGADISASDDTHPTYKMRNLTDVALLLHELPVPSTAKVTGVAVGAAWNLALGCDFVVATPESVFSQIFAKRGLSVDLGGSWLLPRLVGLQRAKRLALLAQTRALLNEGADRTLKDALANEGRAQAVNFATADSSEAYAAFAQKRSPTFTGRWAVPRGEQKDA
jgi:enoyl-CoA hydratase/carnithine racemase